MYVIPAPYTKYKFWLKAFTWKNEGEPSNPPLEAMTDVVGPSDPLFTNLTCKDGESLFLQWDPPEKIYHTIDFYFISYECPELRQYQTVTVDPRSDTFRHRKVKRGARKLIRDKKYELIALLITAMA